MNFKDAFELVNEIHEECGDKNGWRNLREQLSDDTKRFSTYKDWRYNLNMRTDISQDLGWEMECFTGSINVLFALMNRQLPE